MSLLAVPLVEGSHDPRLDGFLYGLRQEIANNKVPAIAHINRTIAPVTPSWKNRPSELPPVVDETPKALSVFDMI